MTTNDDLEQARAAALRQAPLEVWEEAIARSYKMSVSKEEFDGKCTKDAVRKVALYMRGTDYDISMIDDTPDTEEAKLIQLLLDFQAYTDVSDCIHPGVFARDNAFEYCSSCGTDVPRQQL